ncbi:MAG: metallophosphoesterase [Anaerolineaceae bacterium]|nr:metallophosphoesterase [Anaerolineaceae bacterium]
MKLLTVSDKEVPLIYSPQIKERFKDVALALSSGDLSYYYLEYIISSLDIPLYYVRGNHAKIVEYGVAGPRTKPWGAVDLHRKVVRDPKTGLLLAGIEGSLVYNRGKYQYTQAEMWSMVMQLVPALMWNKVRYGRYLDVFVTHAPPWGIHDDDDRAHQGVKAFNWLIETFQPAFHIHGHIHIYRPGIITETKIGKTLVLNTYGYRKLSLPNLPPEHNPSLQTLPTQTEDAASPNS